MSEPSFTPMILDLSFFKKATSGEESEDGEKLLKLLRKIWDEIPSDELRITIRKQQGAQK